MPATGLTGAMATRSASKKSTCCVRHHYRICALGMSARSRHSPAGRSQNFVPGIPAEQYWRCVSHFKVALPGSRASPAAVYVVAP